MAIIVLNPSNISNVVSKEVEIVRLNGKYFIEMEEFDENSDSIVELSIALATENQALKERVALLEEERKLVNK